jgi:hypothetical protein
VWHPEQFISYLRANAGMASADPQTPAPIKHTINVSSRFIATPLVG